MLAKGLTRIVRISVSRAELLAPIFLLFLAATPVYGAVLYTELSTGNTPQASYQPIGSPSSILQTTFHYLRTFSPKSKTLWLLTSEYIKSIKEQDSSAKIIVVSYPQIDNRLTLYIKGIADVEQVNIPGNKTEFCAILREKAGSRILLYMWPTELGYVSYPLPSYAQEILMSTDPKIKVRTLVVAPQGTLQEVLPSPECNAACHLSESLRMEQISVCSRLKEAVCNTCLDWVRH